MPLGEIDGWFHTSLFSTQLRPQLCFLNFAQSILRKLRDKDDLTRGFVGGEPFAAVGDDFLGGGGGVVVEANNGRYALPPLHIRATNDSAGGNGRMIRQHQLNLWRVNIVAAADDQIFFPPLKRKIAVGFTQAKVAGAEPAVGGEGSGRFFRLSPISLADVVAAYLDFADFVIW